jgi:hypothetical protein
MSRLNLSASDSIPEPTLDSQLEPMFRNQIDNLYRLNLYSRWIAIALLWAIVGSYSLWELRYPISLIQEDFTWAAVKYGLISNPLAALGLCLCVGVTTGTLVWQSRNIIWGIPRKEQQRLTKQVCQIRQQGSSHPLWKWIVGS